MNLYIHSCMRICIHVCKYIYACYFKILYFNCFKDCLLTFLQKIKESPPQMTQFFFKQAKPHVSLKRKENSKIWICNQTNSFAISETKADSFTWVKRTLGPRHLGGLRPEPVQLVNASEKDICHTEHYMLWSRRSWLCAVRQGSQPTDLPGGQEYSGDASTCAGTKWQVFKALLIAVSL